eukprot:scaffold16327_cov467-Ochromonas_danica.AAC.1
MRSLWWTDFNKHGQGYSSFLITHIISTHIESHYPENNATKLSTNQPLVIFPTNKREPTAQPICNPSSKSLSQPPAKMPAAPHSKSSRI